VQQAEAQAEKRACPEKWAGSCKTLSNKLVLFTAQKRHPLCSSAQ
jgi:hypothetical protein